MTGFQSKRQASKSLLEQALDALELARDAHCLPGPVNTLVYQAINSISAELAQENPWRDAIDAELICCHIGTVESFPTAKYALNELINWYVKVALDPAVSTAAQALIDRGAAVADEKRDRQHPLNADLLEIKPNGKRTERSYKSTGREGQDSSSSPRSSALHASSAESGAGVTGQEADGNVSKQQAPIPLVPATAVAEPLTERELELIDGMLEVQLHHAAQCDNIQNRTMAERQKGWDMERVELLRKLHGIGIKGSAA